MSNIKHAPTPWKLGREKEADEHIYDANEVPVVFFGWEELPLNYRKNRKFIVLAVNSYAKNAHLITELQNENLNAMAKRLVLEKKLTNVVNSHEELLDVLRRVQQEYTLKVDSKKSTSRDGIMLDTLNEAIAKAEGK